MPYRVIQLAALAVIGLLASPNKLDAGETFPHSAVAVSTGWALEREKEKDEESFSLGLEYEYRATELWGVGIAAEWLSDDDMVRNASLVGLFSLHPIGGLRVFGGPGVEFTDKKDKFLFRAGAGYEFHIAEHWFIAPEGFIDLIETGERTYVFAFALGYTF